jgi:hypothetical protein
MPIVNRYSRLLLKVDTKVLVSIPSIIAGVKLTGSNLRF